MKKPNVVLSSHDWRGSDEHVVWNQGQIRQGKITNSYWEILVKEKGLYEIELCRWPKEGNGRLICEGIVGDDIQWNRNDVDETSFDYYRGGKAINVVEASIKLGDQTKLCAVDYNNQTVMFQVDLEEGPSHLTTFFKTDIGDLLGAYYTYIKRVCC